jgi:uncharacterized protein YkwD
MLFAGKSWWHYSRSFTLSVLFFSFLLPQISLAQGTVSWNDERLNTAKSLTYMNVREKEMIYEINRLRSDPARYARVFIKDRLLKAEKDTGLSTAGNSQYSISTSYENNKMVKQDTVWQNSYVEEYKALKSLYETLTTMEPLSILKPDAGIYKACQLHAADQRPTGDVNHKGTDGSWPWERITKASPGMANGSENIACNINDARAVVLSLLIDSGISGYGHRFTLLNPTWTHVACFEVGQLNIACHFWIQNFGKQKK